MKYILLRLFLYFVFFALPFIFYFTFNTECEISSGGLKNPIHSYCENDFLLYIGTLISFVILLTILGVGLPLLVYIPLTLLLIESIVVFFKMLSEHNNQRQ
jgi:hypothetical protein